MPAIRPRTSRLQAFLRQPPARFYPLQNIYIALLLPLKNDYVCATVPQTWPDLTLPLASIAAVAGFAISIHERYGLAWSEFTVTVRQIYRWAPPTIRLKIVHSKWLRMTTMISQVLYFIILQVRSSNLQPISLNSQPMCMLVSHSELSVRNPFKVICTCSFSLSLYLACIPHLLVHYLCPDPLIVIILWAKKQTRTAPYGRSQRMPDTFLDIRAEVQFSVSFSRPVNH